MIVHNCRIHTAQNSSDNLPSYLQTNTIAADVVYQRRGVIFNTEISQGTVAMQLRCGGMFNNDFIANLLGSMPVKEF